MRLRHTIILYCLELDRLVAFKGSLFLNFCFRKNYILNTLKNVNRKLQKSERVGNGESKEAW